MTQSPKPPSSEVERQISDIRAQYGDSLPVEVYRAAIAPLSWSDRFHFDDQLQQLGKHITGFARRPECDFIPVAIPILEIGLPIKLRGLALPNESEAVCFRTKSLPQDEIWHFSTSADRWEKHLSQRAGLALVRDGVVIELSVSIMS